ncbi:domain of Kin17 curved DNA-binding protein-domain-containing protein [Durotheca rogersii]|uniref:domain of Kin17 curved DNA-binding protein-domain-containing protein n=1 Tax=Durotheca rogersii TaxID=419775 RepID=UPI00221EC473|nr:domain of Kin17 curved DNA-binding protein-domain-containing protein [Durotheca rogersii]KAI5867282.1 domain of Kin17 curved DNA-binding protein-domain-containing protein [Durotheca rogersii]
MPRAEVGSTKYLSNKLKSKGLQRLRWYCQVCEKQCRDANAFKMHTQSESHTRKMLLVGEDPSKHIDEFSARFERDFLQQLRTGHGEKAVHINHFYQGYIADKEHVHMNATRWHSLTEFAKHLGRSGLCRVEENEKGIHVAWIDDSPEALRRREQVRRREALDKGDEEREQMLIREQIRRARRDAGQGDEDEDEEGEGGDNAESRELKRLDGEKIKLAFGAKPAAAAASAAQPASSKSPPPKEDGDTEKPASTEQTAASTAISSSSTAPTNNAVSLKMGAAKAAPKNVFAAAKRNALAAGGDAKRKKAFEPPRKISEAERIMKEELERKRPREFSGRDGGGKRQRM